jgi:hypothetical protein
MKLRLGLFQSLHSPPIVSGPFANQRRLSGTAACLMDAADLPLTCEDGVVGPVLVDPGAEAGRAHCGGHQSIVGAFNGAVNKWWMQNLMETASRSQHPLRMVGGSIAFRDRRVPTHVADWGLGLPNSNRSVTGD